MSLAVLGVFLNVIFCSFLSCKVIEGYTDLTSFSETAIAVYTSGASFLPYSSEPPGITLIDTIGSSPNTISGLIELFFSNVIILSLNSTISSEFLSWERL